MPRFDYQAQAGSLQNAMERMNAAGRAAEDLDQKEQRLRETEERVNVTEEQEAELRNDLVEATERLASAVTRSTSIVAAETAEWNANNMALTENLNLRKQLQTVMAAQARTAAPAAVESDVAAAAATRPAATTAASTAAVSELEQRAARVEAAATAISARAPLALPPGRTTFYAGPGGAPVDYMMGGSRYTGGPPPPPPPRPTVGGAGGADEPSRRATGLAAESTAANEASEAEARLTERVQAAGVAYAESSNALSQHGALTTEFIQALARGDVTLGEFAEQMVSTIGKFGGWAIAGGAVYGVVKLLDDMKNGAVETQNAIATLGRFIPGLGGIAGGGSGQVGQAGAMIRQMSTQFNVPISDVADSMTVVARVFHNLADAGTATSAVLAATKLDQVPVAQATQYLLGISQSMGWTTASPLTGVMNTLNAFQSQLGARVSQTLPAVARAAPAALAGGVSLPTVEELAALGVRAGVPGAQVGTALARSFGGYLFRPAAQLEFARMGITPSATTGEGILQSVFGGVARRAEEGRPYSQLDLRGLANAMTTNVVAARTILPMLEQIQNRPELWQQAQRLATGGAPSYQRDLEQQLTRLSERFASVGIALQNFGSVIGAIPLAPLTAGLSVIHTFIEGITNAVSPLIEFANLIGKLGGPFENLALVIGALVVAAQLYKSTFLGSTAEQFIGRLAGQEEWQNTPRQIVRQRLSELRTTLQPQAETELRQANLSRWQAGRRAQAAVEAQAQWEAQQPAGLVETPGRPGRPGVAAEGTGEAGEAYEAESAAYAQRAGRAMTQFTEAESRAAQAAETVAQIQVDIGVLSGRTKDAEGNRYSYTERAGYAQQRGMMATEEGADLEVNLNTLRGELTQEAQRMIAAYGKMATAAEEGVAEGAPRPPRGGGPGGAPPEGGGGGLGAAGVGAATAVTVGTVAADVLADPAMASNLVTNFQQGLGTYGGAPAGMGAPPPGGFMMPAAPGAGAQLGEEEMTAAAGGLTGPLQRLGNVIEQSSAFQKVSGAVQGVDWNALGQRALAGAPFAGLMATQMLGGAIPGQAGQAIQTVGGGMFGGAMMGQMLGFGVRGMGAGAALAGIATGAAQGGAAGAGISAAGAGVGAAIGTAIEPGLGTLVGAGIGANVADVAASIFGLGPSQPASAPKIAQQATQQENAVQQFGTTFSSNLSQAFSGTTTAATNAQNLVMKTIEDLQAQALLFGPTSKQGAQALQEIGQTIDAALGTLGTNFAGAQQVIQGAIQGQQQTLTRLSQEAKWTTDPKVLDQLLAQGQAAFQPRQYAPSTGEFAGMTVSDLQKAIPQAQQQVRDAQDRLRQAQATGQEQFRTVRRRDPRMGMPESNAGWTQVGGGFEEQTQVLQGGQWQRTAGNPQKAVSQAQQYLAQLKAQLGSVEQVQQYLDAVQQDELETLQQTILQSRLAPIQTAGLLAQAQTMNPVTAAADALTSDAQQLQAIHHQYRGQSPQALAANKTYQEAIQANATQTKQDRETYGQSQTDQLQALGTAQENAVPSVDLIQKATDAVNTQTAIYQYMTQHSDQFTVLQLAQALGNKNAAIQALADANYQTQSDLISAEAQLAQAQAYGDPRAIAQAQITQGERMKGIARTHAQSVAAQAQIVGGQYSAGEAQRTIAQGYASVAEAAASGDTVAQANAAINAANQQLSLAQNLPEQLQAEAQLLTANFQLQSSLAQRMANLGQLAASTTVDPIQQARDLMQGLANALAKLPASDVDLRTQYQTQYNNAAIQAQQAMNTQTEDTINFQYQMMQIPASAAVAQLKALLKNGKDITEAQRHSIEEEIRQYQLGLIQPLGGGAWNVAPGNIRLPTFLDVAHAVTGGRLGQITHTHNATIDASATNTYNIVVNDRKQALTVGDQIDKINKTSLRTRLRQAGVR